MRLCLGAAMGGAGAGVEMHALMLVRDEADIIGPCLDHMLGWAARVYILDTGSTDGTWECVEERARRDRGAVWASRTDELYRCGLRARLLEMHRDRLRGADWIVRADADEFYHDDPREFVRGAVRAGEARVAMWQYLFVLTRGEARAWREGRETLADRARPIEDRRRWYLRDPFPEVRLFRYRRGMRWHSDRPDPANPGPMAGERIRVRHYRYRDPAQMRARLALRSALAARTGLVGRHWEASRVADLLVADDDPGLRRWEDGGALAGTGDWPDGAAHLRMTPTGRLGRLLHGVGLGGALDGALGGLTRA